MDITFKKQEEEVNIESSTLRITTFLYYWSNIIKKSNRPLLMLPLSLKQTNKQKTIFFVPKQTFQAKKKGDQNSVTNEIGYLTFNKDILSVLNCVLHSTYM